MGFRFVGAEATVAGGLLRSVLSVLDAESTRLCLCRSELNASGDKEVPSTKRINILLNQYKSLRT